MKAILLKSIFALLLLQNYILNARTVRIGIYDNPPKVAVNKSGKAYGIFIDIIEYIAKKENWKIKYIYDTWDNNLMRLEKGEIDLIPDAAYSEIRNRQFDFNQITVLPSWLQIYTHKNNQIMTISDLNGKKIAVLKGSIQQQFCKDILNRLHINFDLIEEPDYDGTIKAVESGKADAVIVGRFYSYSYNYKKNNLKPTPLILKISTLHYAVLKGHNQDILSAIDRHLIEILDKSNSIYYKSLEKWLHEKPHFFIPGYVFWSITVISMILIFFIILNFIFKWQIKLQTKKLVIKNNELQNAINELHLSEKKIKSSLIEKERLLQELCHRTKNNMSVICSLLSLKSKMTGDQNTIKFSKDIQSKIHSIALVHKILYQSPDLSSIDIKNYIDEFIKTSLDFYTQSANKIKFNINVENINILIDTAIPFGFVLNELLTNTYKHAFPDKRKGVIEISIYKKNNTAIHFDFLDNGIGVPKKFNFRNQKTFGLQMIFNIIEKQMQGTIDYKVNNGIKYMIEFPISLYTRRI